MTRRRRPLALALAALALAACSGGGGPTGVQAPQFLAAFVPDAPNPGADTVALAAESASGDTVMVAVDVTGISGLRSAEFDLLFDDAALEFLGDSPGTALETSSLPVLYATGTNIPGVLTVGVDLAGVGSVNVGATTPLIRLVFRVKRVGSHAVTFQGESLRDASFQPIPAAWHGGTFTGS